MGYVHRATTTQQRWSLTRIPTLNALFRVRRGENRIFQPLPEIVVIAELPDHGGRNRHLPLRLRPALGEAAGPAAAPDAGRVGALAEVMAPSRAQGADRGPAGRLSVDAAEASTPPGCLGRNPLPHGTRLPAGSVVGAGVLFRSKMQAASTTSSRPPRSSTVSPL